MEAFLLSSFFFRWKKRRKLPACVGPAISPAFGMSKKGLSPSSGAESVRRIGSGSITADTASSASNGLSAKGATASAASVDGRLVAGAVLASVAGAVLASVAGAVLASVAAGAPGSDARDSSIVLREVRAL